MKTKNDHIVEGFSAVRMKQELQDQFQRKTAGMSFKELRRFLDDSLEPLPHEEQIAESQERAMERAGEPFDQEHLARIRAKRLEEKKEAEKKAAEEKDKK